MYNLPSNKNLEKLRKLFVKLNWGLAFFVAFLYLTYLIAFFTGKAGQPINGAMGPVKMILGFSFLVGLQFFYLWLGKNYNLTQINDGYVPRGYHKGSELFMCCWAFFWGIILLSGYYTDLAPAFY